jgi:hypothetical protein
MQDYEYKLIPAPARAERDRALKTTAERFAQTLSVELNRMAAEGWEYLRADVLPCEERTGLTGRRATSYHTLLVFRRALASQPAPVATPRPDLPPAFLTEAAAGTAPRLSAQSAAGAAPRLGPAAPES